jgi:hypothetical protein
MPRGGSRNGKPGASYSNRSDLNAQPVRTATNQPYGQAGQQQAAQRAIPLPTQGGAPVGPQPAPLNASTQRPNEPLTAGIPTGPGPGPEVLSGGAGTGPDATLEGQLRGLYQANPNPDLAKLIATIEMRNR